MKIKIEIINPYKSEHFDEMIKKIKADIEFPMFPDSLGCAHVTALQKDENGKFRTDDNQYSYGITYDTK